jgi:NADH-quinone oxidoreductase subunit H
MTSILFTLIEILIIILLLLLSIAYLTLLERKILAMIQRRQGPNVIGTFGLLQPLADGFKLLMKESLFPSSSNKFLFALAPIISFTVSLVSWGVIPFAKKAVYSDISLGLLYLLSVSALGIYGIIISGWSSNSKYAFLGALRSSAQMISYELSIGFSILCVIACTRSLNLSEIVFSQRYVWFFIPLFVPFLIFFVSGLAETNRHPFDLPEAEAELVSGYNVEYSAVGFTLFFLAEYSNILLMCSLNSILFFGGWLPPFEFLTFIPGSFWFGLKVTLFSVLFIYVRAILPRYRYDQLMHLGWKVLLPVAMGYLFLTVATLFAMGIYLY